MYKLLTKKENRSVMALLSTYNSFDSEYLVIKLLFINDEYLSCGSGDITGFVDQQLNSRIFFEYMSKLAVL